MFTYADFYNYMIIMPGYDHNGWKACKGLQGYKLYQVSHIVNLQQYDYDRFQGSSDSVL